MFHSPWPLFGDDLNLARSWIRPKLHGLVSVRTGHLAINLGLGDALLAGVSEGSVQAEIKALRQWRFRISRLHGDANPYRHLVPRWYFEKTLAAIATSKTAGLPLHVELNGGIGDHIEALSLLLPWTKTQDHTLNLRMSSERQKQIAPLLSKWKRIQCNVSLEHGHPEAPIKVMALRAALVSSNEPMHYRPFLISEQTRQSSGLHWLCCWRAEGRGDSLSAHSRSVPWALVWEFYHHIKSLQPKSCIVDITKWRNWEANQLKAMGISVLDPRQETLLGLAQRCRTSRVVTIDTALVHLCAAAGQPANMLLSPFHDERWRELHKPEHHYGQLIKLWRSSQFGSWRAVLDSLAGSLSAES